MKNFLYKNKKRKKENIQSNSLHFRNEKKKKKKKKNLLPFVCERKKNVQNIHKNKSNLARKNKKKKKTTTSSAYMYMYLYLFSFGAGDIGI